MSQFKTLYGLPRCAGAIDGTFMKILKPTCDFSDPYWCYKKFPAIILLATCDANGVFTFVDAGRAGSLGDAATFQASTLCNNIDNDEWLQIAERTPGRNEISGTYIRPYLAGDAAFRLSPTMMKCYESNNPLQPHEKTFNHRLIRTRRVIEQAFGRLNGRFRIVSHSSLKVPKFAANVALVCCGLHNICERWSCPANSTWTINAAEYHPGPNDPYNNHTGDAGVQVRNKLASHVHRVHAGSPLNIFFSLSLPDS